MLILLSPPQRGEIAPASASPPIADVGGLRKRWRIAPISSLLSLSRGRGRKRFRHLSRSEAEAKCPKAQEGGSSCMRARASVGAAATAHPKMLEMLSPERRFAR